MAKNVFRQKKKSVSISASGALNIKAGKVKLTGSRLDVKLESGRAIHPLRGVQLSAPLANDYLPGGGSRVYATFLQSGLEITTNFIFPEAGSFVGLSVQVKNLQGAVIPLQSITLVKIPLRKIKPIGAAPKPYMLVESDYSSDDVGLHALSGEPGEDEIEGDASANMTAFFVPGGECLFAGCLPGGRSFNRFVIDGDRFVITADFNGEIPPYSTFETDLLVLNGFDTLHTSLQQFGALCRGRKRAVEAMGCHSWTSTGSYSEEIAESDIMDNLEFLKETPWIREGVKYVVVGKGWQQCEGDWEANKRFPSFLDTLAGRIRSAGFIPGVWVAPLNVDDDSTLAEENPEWLLKKAPRKGAQGQIKCLDFTLPEVKDFVYHTMRKLYNWGYRYFRTDFSAFEGQLDAFRYRGEKAASVLDHLKTIMMTIRSAIGEDSIWVAVNTSLSPVTGLCDAVSTGRAVTPYFSTILGAARSSMFRAQRHGLSWLAEPGMLMVQGPETLLDDKPAGNNKSVPASAGSYQRYEPDKGPKLSFEEAKIWATWLIASGGVLTLGDRLASLNIKGLGIVKKVLMRAGAIAAEPLDFGVVPLSRIWYRNEGSTAILALFNWSEKQSDIVVSQQRGITLPENRELFDVWNEETIRIGEEKTFRRRLPPHSCELFEWDL